MLIMPIKKKNMTLMKKNINKSNLLDVTFIIPVRISHVDRLNNLEFLINYLTNNFNTNIIVYEADTTIKITKNILDKVTHMFEYTSDNIFHRTKYLNNMLKKVTTKYVVNQDCDVFLPLNVYTDAVNLLNNGVDVVYPYNGEFVNFNRNELDDVCKTFNPKDSQTTLDSYGGMIFFNTEVYKNGGGEDERFYGWGFEDRERVSRFRKLGYRVERMSNRLYHIDHHRDINSGSDHPNFKKNENIAHQMIYNKVNMEETIKLLKKNLQNE